MLLPKLEHHDEGNLLSTQQQTKKVRSNATFSLFSQGLKGVSERTSRFGRSEKHLPVCLSKTGLAGLRLLHSSTDTTQQDIIFGCLITALLKLKQFPTLFSENIFFRYLTSAKKTNPTQVINNSPSSNLVGCFNKSHKFCDKYI